MAGKCPVFKAFVLEMPILSVFQRFLASRKVSEKSGWFHYRVAGSGLSPKLKMRRSDPCRFESGHRHHVGAKSALLRRLFVPAAKKTSSARSLAHPFQIEPAALGFDLGLGADWRAAASMLLRCIKNPERKRVRDFVLFERARGRGDVSAPLLMCPRAAGVSGWPPGGAFG